MRGVPNIVEILREEENSGKLISIIDSTEQKKAEQTIKHSLEFEKTISVISSRFIGSYDNDDAIDMSLSEIGNFTGASRVYLFLLRNNGTVMSNTHEWCNNGVIPQKDILQNIPTEASPWWIGKLRKGEVIHVEDVSKMPEEAGFEKHMLEKQEIKSLLVCPLKIGEKLNGFIGLDNVLVAGKWNYEDFAILRVCSEIIGNALERRQTEEELRKRNDFIETILDNLPIGLAVNTVDDGVTRYLNKAFERIYGWPKEDLVSVEEYFNHVYPDPVYRKELKEKILSDIASGDAARMKWENLIATGKDGKQRVIDAENIPLLEQNMMISTAQDITKRKQAEERTKQQNKIDILRAEIWELAAQPLSENELIQQLVDKVGPFFNLDSVNFMKIHPEEKAVVVEVQWQNGNKSGVGVNIPLWALKRGVFGKPYFVASLKDLPLYARPIIAPFFKKYGVKSSLLVAFGDIDSPKGYIVASDTTDRDWSEEEINIFAEAVKIISLRAEKVKAEEKAKNHQIKIEQQNIKLRKLDQLKSDFINVTSHELRTPMASIKGYVQMLSMGSLGEITEEQEKSLEIVLRNINRLDRLIQDILDLSQLESGTMEFVPEEIDLQKMIDEVTETMRSSADIKDIKIGNEVEEQLPHLTIDPERIKQVIINLTNNAIKFSPDGSVINLKVKKEQENVLFEVEDFGRGIPKDKQERVFETFYQVDSGMKRSFGGAGLGLAISKDIILAHEGKIWVESEGIPRKGSTFRFTLPIKSVKDIEERFKGVDKFKLENEI